MKKVHQRTNKHLEIRDSFKSFLKQERLSDLRSSGTEFQGLALLKRILNFLQLVLALGK